MLDSPIVSEQRRLSREEAGIPILAKLLQLYLNALSTIYVSEGKLKLNLSDRIRWSKA